MAVKLRFPTAPAFHEISDARFDATHKVLALLRKMEKWEIALGGDFQAFKKVLSHSLNAWGECADQLALVLMPYVSQPQNVPAPTENSSSRFGNRRAISGGGIHAARKRTAAGSPTSGHILNAYCGAFSANNRAHTAPRTGSDL